MTEGRVRLSGGGFVRAAASVELLPAQAQAFHDQGLDYLHGYVWIEAARS